MLISGCFEFRHGITRYDAVTRIEFYPNVYLVGDERRKPFTILTNDGKEYAATPLEIKTIAERSDMFREVYRMWQEANKRKSPKK